MPEDVITAEGAALERARGRVEFALRRASEGSPDLETLDSIARALTSALGYMTIAQPCTLSDAHQPRATSCPPKDDRAERWSVASANGR